MWECEWQVHALDFLSSQALSLLNSHNFFLNKNIDRDFKEN